MGKRIIQELFCVRVKKKIVSVGKSWDANKTRDDLTRENARRREDFFFFCSYYRFKATVFYVPLMWARKRSEGLCWLSLKGLNFLLCGSYGSDVAKD